MKLLLPQEPMKKLINYRITQENSEILLYFAWVVSICAFLGSLFFSDVLKLVPCKLCWFQRICMYPLVFIIGVSLIVKDKKVPYYILPLSTIGWVIAFYHVLLYNKILPEAVGFCEAGISCTTKYVSYFGFLSIPMMSLIAFTLITSFSIYYYKLNK